MGNPSDGYHGKTISFAISQYWAEVTLDRSKFLVIDANPTNQFESINQLHRNISAEGYYGADRLLKATIKRFADYCEGRHELHDSNFRISFSSCIPRQVGLAGSSAIITATLRALMDWYSVAIPAHLLASLTLSVERELGIPAGLQDRVIQAYQGLVYMDFDRSQMQTENGLAFGHYESLDPSKLANIYVAFANDAGQPTEVLHNDLRARFENGDREIIAAMDQFAAIAAEGKTAIEAGEMDTLSRLIDQNFDLRASICDLHPLHREMVTRARKVGASAKFCGSGGAIVGLFADAEMFESLKEAMDKIDCCAFVPIIEQ